jgi:hypothetical protein
MTRSRLKDEQLAGVFYGINSKTFAVDRIYLTYGGTLKKYDKGAVVGTHHPIHDGPISAETRLAFDVTDVFSVPVEQEGDEATRQRIEALKVRARAMEAQRT